MRKIILLLAAPFIFFTAQADLIKQQEADNIVLELMSQEMKQHTIYAHEEVQKKWTITSVDGELLDVNYSFWIYYIDYTNNTGKYLLVKESNGNVLEVNVKREAKPDDLGKWRIVEGIEIVLEMGMYVETVPEKGRTTINFIDGENLVMQGEYPWMSEAEYLKYEIVGNKIKLTSGAGSSGHYFRIINNRKFEIGFLYATIACGNVVPPIMIFEKEENDKCNVNNPLTDLPWLVEKIDEITLLFQQGKPLQTAIYQCVYGNGEIGFLLYGGNISHFYNCNGDVLCMMGGFMGETCPKLKIVSQKLIWEIND